MLDGCSCQICYPLEMKLLLLVVLEILGEAIIRIRIIIIQINQIIEESNHYSSSGSLLIRQLLHGFTRHLAWRSG